MGLINRLRNLVSARALETEVEEEMRFHLDARAEDNMRAGMTPEQARKDADRRFGNRLISKEATRGADILPSLETVAQDLRYALRSLRKNPGFATAAILSLALGIGANTAIFSLLNAVVLRALPVDEPKQLVQLTYTFPSNGPNNWNSWFGYPQLDAFRTQSKTLSGVFGGVGLGRVSIEFKGASGLAQGDAYTGNFLSVLGVTPQYGRFFGPEDDKPDASVAIISDRYWNSRFGGDRAIVGSSININQLPFTVIGITPTEFTGVSLGAGPDVWVPLHALDRMRPDPKRWTQPFTSWLLIAGRLAPGVSQKQAQAELDVIHRQLLEEQLAASEIRRRESQQRFVQESHLVLLPAANGTVSGVRQRYGVPLKLLMGIAAMVLLVACANVANLLLARASSRQREIAIRLALGASRARIVRQLLTESMLLSSIGGILAFAIAWWGSVALVRMISTGDSPVPLDVHPDWRVFGFAAAVSIFTGLLFGIAPAVRGTRVGPGPAMKAGAYGRRANRLRADRLLVVAQVALSLVLVMGAALFVRTLQKLWNVNLGYDRENVLMFSVDARLAGHATDRISPLYRDILQRLRQIPDVQSASVSIVRPLDDSFYLVDSLDRVDGRELAYKDRIRVAWNSMSPGYFATAGMPILLGRDFDLRDDEEAAKVVIINEALARRAFPGMNPIGHSLGAATVIGVVKDSNYNGLRDEPRPVLYHSLFQHGKEQEYRWGFVSFEMRYRRGAGLLDEARRQVVSVDRNLTIFRAKTLSTQIQQSLLAERLLATISTFFGALALMLACLGLHGLMAYTVARKTPEIGIRLALGARHENIIWLVLRTTLGLTLAGVIVGLPLVFWAGRYAESLLFNVKTTDSLTIAMTVAAFLIVALIASYLPARRAVRIDPIVALRYE